MRSGFLQRVFGVDARQQEREAYLKALTLVVEAQKAQSDLFREWIGMFKTNASDTPKGWTNDDRRLWLEEVKAEKGEEFFPPGTPDDQIEWLTQQVGSGDGF